MENTDLLPFKVGDVVGVTAFLTNPTNAIGFGPRMVFISEITPEHVHYHYHNEFFKASYRKDITTFLHHYNARKRQLDMLEFKRNLKELLE